MEGKSEPSDTAKIEMNGDSTAKADPKSAEARKDSSNSKRLSRERTKLTETLLSRANTMLRTANFSREHTQLSKPKTDREANSGTIVTAVASLEREKTKLETSLEDDEEMQQFLMDMKKQKNAKAKEFTDSDFDTDLEDEIVQTSTPSAGEEKKLYQQTCKKLGIRPVPVIERALQKGKEVVVKNRCMDALDTLSIANALISNPKIVRLTLDGNKLGDEGAICIAWLLKDQESFLESVSLAENDIGDEGFGAIGEMLRKNRLVTHLNLSGNKCQDENIIEIARALIENRRLNSLNLSHNCIGDIGAFILGPAVAANDGLHALDLSWNKIRPAGAIAIVSALRENIILKSLNLQMNGLSSAGAAIMADVLKKNETLTYLNLAFNRIFDKGCAYIAKGMESNEALHHLILHDNPITASGALTILGGIRNNKGTGMWKLDMHTTPVVKQCTEIADEISYNCGGDFEFRHAGLVDSEVNMVATDSKLDTRNPMAVVKNYVEEEGLRMIDFFKQMDRDGSGSISHEEFVEGLAMVNVPLSIAQIETLIDMLDKDGDGEIDLGELIDGERQYKRMILKKKMQEMELIKQHIAKQKENEKERAKFKFKLEEFDAPK